MATATHTHDTLGQVELRGTRKVGRGNKSRTVALVHGVNGNSQVELDTLTPIRRSVRPAATTTSHVGFRNRGPARSERSALRLENRDRSRLGVKGDSGARSCLEYARNIAPESLRDLEPKAWPVLQLRGLDTDGLGVKARIASLVIDHLRKGAITVDQALKLCRDNGIDATY